MRGCNGFDLQCPYRLRAEDVGWPPKKAGKTTNAKQQSSNIFAINESDFALDLVAA